jgi:hypothetical protein
MAARKVATSASVSRQNVQPKWRRKITSVARSRVNGSSRELRGYVIAVMSTRSLDHQMDQQIIR